MRLLTSKTLPELQLQKEIIKQCREKIGIQAEKRRGISNIDEWNVIKDSLIEHIKSSFHSSVLNRTNPLNVREVSRHDCGEYRVENVLFESMPGWDVNATVYTPKAPGIYPGIVCPTGHSSKTGESYQVSAQVFARNGYIAISFDPPGCAGEIGYMNNHFSNGLIGYLTGIWSNTHFVIDAIRCMDYLETRQDIAMNSGMAVTGVSGGGCTSIYTALVDDRVNFFAPVCCLAEHESIHFSDLYTSCPEQFGPNFIKEGLDYVDLLAVQVPKPCLIVAGQKDEVFDYRSTKRLYHELERIYKLYGAQDNLGLYIQEDSGHAYTIEMANEVVGWMNRIIKKQDVAPIPIKKEDVKIQSADLLKCYPAQKANMFTINRDEGRRLKEDRILKQGRENRKYLIQKAKEILGLENQKGLYLKVEEEKNPPTRWAHQLQKVDIEIEDGVHVPGLLYKRAVSTIDKGLKRKRPALLFVDEAGKWKGFHQGAYLSRAGRFLEMEDDPNEPMILSIDVSGLGELSPQPTSYDMASWNDIERILTYLSVACGMPVMGLRIRDALAALEYLRNRNDVDHDQIMIAGRGMGAIVALHTALFAGEVKKLILWEMLINYQSMTERFPFHWPQSIIIPGILKYYDLEDIMGAVCCEDKVLINPLDAAKMIVSIQEIEKIYNKDVKTFVVMEEVQAGNILVNQIISGSDA